VKINASDKIMFESQTKKNNKRNFYINVHLKDRWDRIQGELMPEEALTLFTVSDAHH